MDKLYDFITYKQTGVRIDPETVKDTYFENLQPITSGFFDSSINLTDNDNNNKIDSESPAKGVMNMNNGSFDTLFGELKADMREREERSRREISEREDRFKEQLSSYAQESSKREDRVISLVEGIKQDIVQSEERISQNVQNSEQRIQATETRISDTLEKLEATMATHVEHMESMKTQNLWGTFALFAGMLAIVVALIIAIN